MSLFGNNLFQNQNNPSNQGLFSGLGSQNTGGKPTSLFGGGGSSNQSQGGLFGQQTISQQPSSLFGSSSMPQQTQQSSLFGSNAGIQPSQTTNLFGSTQPQIQQSGSIFNSFAQQPQQQNPQSGLFGGSTNPQQTQLFGSNQQTNFGGTQKSLFAGSNQNTPTFNTGQTSSNLFGSNQQQGLGLFGGNTSNVQTQQNKPLGMSGLFGNQNTQSNNTSMGMGQTGSVFGGGNKIVSTQPGTSHVRYQPTKAQETSNVSNKVETINLFSITAMPEFQMKSIEELRSEDYKNKKSGGMIGSTFNSMPIQNTFSNTNTGMGFAPTTTTTSTTSNLFGGTNQSSGLFQSANKTGSSLFGGQTQGSSVFGNQTQPTTQTNNLFGAQTSNSLFGQPTTTTTNPSTSIFGATSQPTSSNLFGKSNTNVTPSNSLFGGQSTTGGNLFGGSTLQPNTTLQQNPSTSLFGGTTTQPQNPSTSLFGATTTQTQNPSTSLFGGTTTTQQNPSTSLFGGTTTQQQNPSNSLFGGSTTTQPASSNLFGGAISQPSTSLFPSSNTGSSLFGGDNKGSTAGGSLFGATTGGSSLFGGSTGTASTSLFGDNKQTSTSLFGTNTGTTNLNAQPSTSLFSNVTSTAQPQPQNYVPNSLGLPFPSEYLMKPPKSLPELMSQLQKSFDVSESLYKREMESNIYKTNINLGSSKYSYFAEENNEGEERPKKHTYNNFFFEQSSPKLKSKRTNNLNNLVYNFKATHVYDDKWEYAHNILNLNSKVSSVKNVVEDSSAKQQVFNSFIGMNLGEEIKTFGEGGLIELRLNLQDPVKLNFSLKVHKNIKVSLLKTRIIERVKEDSHKQLKKINSSSFILMKKHSIIRENMTLDEAGIKDKDTLHILMKAIIEEKGDKLEKKKKTGAKTLAPLEKLPVLTKGGYKTTPDFRSICRMSEEELKNVKNFSIFNQFGKIQFLEDVDLTELNLDRIITIEDKSILVYQNYKPDVGSELNKPAILHLYKCFPLEEYCEDLTTEEINHYIQKLKRFCKERNAEFVDYNRITGEWIFRVENFN